MNCCSDQSPALHDGLVYCQACDQTLLTYEQAMALIRGFTAILGLVQKRCCCWACIKGVPRSLSGCKGVM